MLPLAVAEAEAEAEAVVLERPLSPRQPLRRPLWSPWSLLAPLLLRLFLSPKRPLRQRLPLWWLPPLRPRRLPLRRPPRALPRLR